MKELLLQYAKYNLWANKRIMDVLLALDEGKLDIQIESSFPTLRDTVLHMWGAEDIWLQRLNLVETPVWLVPVFKGTFTEACEGWAKTSAALIAFTEKQFDDRSFQHVIQYYNSKKEHFKISVSTVLQHTFNHATYHRGQLVTMLRQVGITKIPVLDLFIFSRGV